MALAAARGKQPGELGVDALVGDEASRELLGPHAGKAGELSAALVLPDLGGEHRLVQLSDQLRGEFRKAEVDRRASVGHVRLGLRRGQRQQVGLEVELDASEDLHAAAADVAMSFCSTC